MTSEPRPDRPAAIALVLIAVVEVGVLAWDAAQTEYLAWLAPWLVGFALVFLGLAFGVGRGWRRAEVVAAGFAGAWALVSAWSIAMRWSAWSSPAFAMREFGAAAAMIALGVFTVVRLARR